MDLAMGRPEINSGEHLGPEGISTPGILASLHDFSSVRVASETLGNSALLGPLSVPPAWPTANRAVDLPPPLVGDPEITQGGRRGITYQQGLMGMITGHGDVTEDVIA